MRWVPALVAALACGSCAGSTGGQRFYFLAYAAGPLDARAGQPLFTDTSRGWRVRIDRAQLYVGGVYLNQRNPANDSLGAADPSCFIQGVYAAQVTTGRQIDLLDPTPQYFPIAGTAVGARARAGELWLTGGAVDALEDSTPIVELAGLAQRAGVEIPFRARVTIGSNRQNPAPSTVTPGLNPICKQRIVSPIPADFEVSAGGTLEVRADPRAFFTNVDFAALPESDDDPSIREFPDNAVQQPSIALFNALRARVGVYTFTWQQP